MNNLVFFVNYSCCIIECWYKFSYSRVWFDFVKCNHTLLNELYVLIKQQFLNGAENVDNMCARRWQISFTVKKTYALIAFTWIFPLVYQLLINVPTTDIIDGCCLSYEVWTSWLAYRIVPMAVAGPVEYYFPVVMIAFCYGRMYHVLKQKVTLAHFSLKFRLESGAAWSTNSRSKSTGSDL